MLSGSTIRNSEMLLLSQSADLVPPTPPAQGPAATPITTLFLKPRESLILGSGQGAMFFRVKDGCVAISRHLPDGRRQICDIIGPGRLFGFALQGGDQGMAESLTYSTVERHGPRSARISLPDEVGQLLNRQQSHALLLGRKTAVEKVASALIDLADQFSRTGGARPCFALFPTRSDLADWLGLTFETVSRCLHRFKREKLIEFERPEQIRILDMRELQRVAGATHSPST